MAQTVQSTQGHRMGVEHFFQMIGEREVQIAALKARVRELEEKLQAHGRHELNGQIHTGQIGCGD